MFETKTYDAAYLGAFRFAAVRYIVFAGVLMNSRGTIWNEKPISSVVSRDYSKLTFTVQSWFIAKWFITPITDMGRSVASRYPLMADLLVLILRHKFFNLTKKYNILAYLLFSKEQTSPFSSFLCAVIVGNTSSIKNSIKTSQIFSINITNTFETFW